MLVELIHNTLLLLALSILLMLKSVPLVMILFSLRNLRVTELLVR